MGGTGSGQKAGTVVSWGDGQNFCHLGDLSPPGKNPAVHTGGVLHATVTRNMHCTLLITHELHYNGSTKH